MHPDSPLLSWLDHLWVLYPAQNVLVIGAGNGTSPWTDALQRWQAPRSTLVEADEAQFQQLQHSPAAREGWHFRKQVIASQTGSATFYTASNPAESGLIEPESLRALWPNLKTRQKTARQAISLTELLAATEPNANWLIIDCLTADDLLASTADGLGQLDVIVTRTLLPLNDAGADSSGKPTFTAIQQTLEAQGFTQVATQQARNPGIAHTLHVRNHSARIRQLTNQCETQLTTLQAEIVKSREAAQQALDQKKQTQQQLAAAQTETAQWREATEKARADATQLKIQVHEVQQQIESFFKGASRQHNELKTLLSNQKTANDELAQQVAQLSQAATFSTALEGPLAKQLAGTKDSLKETETRLRNELSKGLGNAVKQVEAFLRIQNYLGTGDALGDFHGWPISPDIGLFLLEKMREQHYDLVIEFGSGTSTALFAKVAEVISQESSATDASAGNHRPSCARTTEIISFEHDSHYYTKTQQMLKARGLEKRVSLIHAPLVDWNDGESNYLFYSCEPTLQELAQKYSSHEINILLFVDGPPGTTCANARYPAVPFIFSAFGRHKIDTVLDDASRPEEKQVIDLWKTFWKKRSIRLVESQIQTEKGTYFSRMIEK